MGLPQTGRVLLAGLALLDLTGAAPGPEPIRFNTHFEGGSLGRVEPIGEAAFRCHIRGQQDERGRNRQASWYCFRIDGARGREVTLVLTDFVGEYNGRPGAVPMGPDILPVASDDGESWRPIADVRWDDRAKEATIRIRPRGTASGLRISRPTHPGGWPGCSSRSTAAKKPGSRSSASRRRAGTCTSSR